MSLVAPPIARRRLRPCLPTTPSRLATPVLLPCLVALTYLGVLVARYPEILRWQNSDSDIASAYTLTDAIAAGHTGPVTLSTQGDWIELGWGLLTHGLAFHRILWELSAPAVTLLAVAVLAWAVHRVAGRAAAALTAAIVLAASPAALQSFTSADFHNLAIIGTALLDAYGIWLLSAHRRPQAVAVSVVLMGVLSGAMVACDALLAVIGLVPFLLVGFILAFRTREYRSWAPNVAVTAIAVVVAQFVNAVMTSLHFRTVTPPLRVGGPIGLRAHWLYDGLLRLGAGKSTGVHPAVIQPLVLAAALVTAAGLVGALWVAGRPVRPMIAAPGGRARAFHAKFWGASLLVTVATFLVTNDTFQPSDRYLVVAVPAVASLVPLLITSRRRAWLVSGGATLFAAASLCTLAAPEAGRVFYHGQDVPFAVRIQRIVATHHLGIGYAGYWDAASLQWSTDERLHVIPLYGTPARTMPMFLERVAAWYVPRPHTPSYLILAPGDQDMPDAVPRDLPAPAHVYRVGDGVRIAAWPFDIARDLESLPR